MSSSHAAVRPAPWTTPGKLNTPDQSGGDLTLESVGSIFTDSARSLRPIGSRGAMSIGHGSRSAHNTPRGEAGGRRARQPISPRASSAPGPVPAFTVRTHALADLAEEEDEAQGEGKGGPAGATMGMASAASLAVEEIVLPRGRRLSSAHHTLQKDEIAVLTASEKRSYWFRHPWSRVAVCVGIIFMNFFMLAEDPQAHSNAPAEIPAIGNAFSLLFLQWPDHGGYVVLKLLIALISVIGGCIFMLYIVHNKCLRPRFPMFEEDKGSWWIMFTGSILFCFAGAIAYNVLLMLFIGSDEAAARGWQLDGKLGVTNRFFAETAAVGTWLGDFVTAFMVIDMVLQSARMYPDWHPELRDKWQHSCGGKFRIIMFWVTLVFATITVLLVFFRNLVTWDSFNKGWIFTDEMSRGLLASTITTLDVCILIQDWDFPEFNTVQGVKLPGLGIAHVKVAWAPLKGLDREWFKFEITGKWFNYGILLFVIMLDMNMLKNQVVYNPAVNAQYTGPDSEIWSIVNTTDVERALANATMLSWEVRQGCCGDVPMNAKYRGYPLWAKLFTTIPALVSIGSIVYLVKQHRREIHDLIAHAKAAARFKKLRGVVAARDELGLAKRKRKRMGEAKALPAKTQKSTKKGKNGAVVSTVVNIKAQPPTSPNSAWADT